jgi:hypothetical protein
MVGTSVRGRWIPGAHGALGVIGCGLLCLAGCIDGPTGSARRRMPAISAVTVTAGEHNVLSAVVMLHADRADSARLRFRAADAAIVDSSPSVQLADNAATLYALGLLPQHRYIIRPVAYGRAGVTVGDSLEITTGSLPVDLPRYVASGSDPSPGFVVFAAGRYGVVIDNTGRVVWYKDFPGGVGLSFMAEPSGVYVARPSTPTAGDIEPWVEIDVVGSVTRTLDCAGGLVSRPHDLIVGADRSHYILCDETRVMDLSSMGGVAGARVTGTVVQHVGVSGELLFQWSPFDRFVITDLPVTERAGGNVNWTHGNSLEIDTDGSLLVSFRNLGEITKINTGTGAVMWRLGGAHNDFTFVETPSPAFLRQHSVRVRGKDTLIILDNSGDRAESRAEQYVLGESGRLARLAQSYGSLPAVITDVGGSVQPLAHGRTLVSFGTTGRVEEYDASGRLVWRIEGNPGYIFRAQRILSLYAPGVGTAR